MNVIIGDKALSSLCLLPSFNSRAPPVLSPRRSQIRSTLLNCSSSLQISPYPPKFRRGRPFCSTTVGASSAGSSVEQLASNDSNAELEGNWESTDHGELDRFDFDKEFESTDMKKIDFSSPMLEVKELQELPENWRRSRLAWLCKELPAHKRPTMTRLLNAQKKWLKQEDATYVAVHCMRIRENEAGFWTSPSSNAQIHELQSPTTASSRSSSSTSLSAAGGVSTTEGRLSSSVRLSAAGVPASARVSAAGIRASWLPAALRDAAVCSGSPAAASAAE